MIVLRPCQTPLADHRSTTRAATNNCALGGSGSGEHRWVRNCERRGPWPHRPPEGPQNAPKPPQQTICKRRGPPTGPSTIQLARLPLHAYVALLGCSATPDQRKSESFSGSEPTPVRALLPQPIRCACDHGGLRFGSPLGAMAEPAGHRSRAAASSLCPRLRASQQDRCSRRGSAAQSRSGPRHSSGATRGQGNCRQPRVPTRCASRRTLYVGDRDQVIVPLRFPQHGRHLRSPWGRRALRNSLQIRPASCGK